MNIVTKFKPTNTVLALAIGLLLASPQALSQDQSQTQIPELETSQLATPQIAQTPALNNSAAIDTLQSTTSPQPPQSSIPSVRAIENIENQDESSLLGEVAKYQARLSMINMVAKIEKAKMDLEREQMKFEEEQRKAAAEALTSASIPGLQTGLQSGLTNSANTSGAIVSLPIEEVIPDPFVRTIYHYDGKSFAEVVIDNTEFVVEPGTILSTGEKVAVINPTNIVILRKGKKVTIPLQAKPTTVQPNQPLSTSIQPPINQ